MRGAGGWGGERGPSADVNVPPDRAPDKVIEDKTTENQALLYRLSGDWNPLHADPAFAKAFGFAKPILHGLGSFGFATRHVAQAFAPGGDVSYVKSIKVRFASTVLPGETLVTEMWKESDTRIVFRCKVKERGEVCISNAAIELWKELPKPKDRSAKPAGASTGAAAAMPISADIFHAMDGFVKANPATAEKVKTVFQFRLASPASTWTVDLSTPPGAVTSGETAKPQCTLDLSDADFMAMATGQADPMKLFSTGKLKISGDVMASQKLGFLKKITPEMVIAEMKKRGGEPRNAQQMPSVVKEAWEAAVTEPTLAEVFAVIDDHLKTNPELASQAVGTMIYQWKIGGAPWILDLKNGSGSTKAGESAADCTLEIAESDLPGNDAGQGGRDEAVHDRQAEDQRRRDGVAEARVPAQDGSDARHGGRREAARGERRRGGALAVTERGVRLRRSRHALLLGDLRGKAQRSGVRGQTCRPQAEEVPRDGDVSPDHRARRVADWFELGDAGRDDADADRRRLCGARGRQDHREVAVPARQAARDGRSLSSRIASGVPQGSSVSNHRH